MGNAFAFTCCISHSTVENGCRNHEHIKQLCLISNLSDDSERYITSHCEQMPTTLTVHIRVLHAHFMSRCVIVVAHNAVFWGKNRSSFYLERSRNICSHHITWFYVGVRKHSGREVSLGWPVHSGREIPHFGNGRVLPEQKSHFWL